MTTAFLSHLRAELEGLKAAGLYKSERVISSKQAGTIEVVLKYAPGTDPDVLGLAYDELIRIGGFGVDGGMTKANLKVAYDLALQNKQIDRPGPLDQWVDFRFQDQALASLGPFTR